MNLVGAAAAGERCFAEPMRMHGTFACDDSPAAVVRRVLSTPDDQLDYAKAKLALDRVVDSAFDQDAVLEELDRLTRVADDLAGPDAPELVRLGSVQRLIYEPGPWNDHRPIEYDHTDPFGRSRPNKLLHHLLEHRLGQCVSMPILFLILADRLGLNVGLCSAPEHMFVRYTDPGGRVINIEATSGGHPTRDSFIREHFPMSDRAIESGLYLRTLSRRETIALMASTVIEHLARERRYRDLIETAEVILNIDLRSEITLVSYGSAFGRLADGYNQKYGSPFLVPLLLRHQYLILKHHNHAIIEAAEALGWQAPDHAN